MKAFNLNNAKSVTVEPKSSTVIKVEKSLGTYKVGNTWVNPKLWGLPTLYQSCDNCKTETVQYRNGEEIECPCGFKYNPKKIVNIAAKDLKKPATFTFIK